jgi:hypothetical protein
VLKLARVGADEVVVVLDDRTPARLVAAMERFGAEAHALAPDRIAMSR